MAREHLACKRYHAPGRTYCRDCWPPRGRGRGESLTSPRRIDAKLRSIDVLQLRAEYRMSWAEIARRLGFKGRSGAYMAYRRAMNQHPLS